MTDLLQLLHDLGRIRSAEADDVKTTFSQLCAMAQTKHRELFETYNRDQNLDAFYAKLLEKQTSLWKAVRMILILYHGNASVESGFSVNKELLFENIQEDTIVA